MVSMLAFHSNDSSSNPDEIKPFLDTVFLFEKIENKIKRV